MAQITCSQPPPRPDPRRLHAIAEARRELEAFLRGEEYEPRPYTMPNGRPDPRHSLPNTLIR